METNRANQVIVEVLQGALAGQLKPESTVNPQRIAEAIATKVEFEKTYNDTKSDTLAGTLIDKVVALKNDAEAELEKSKRYERDRSLINGEEQPSLIQNYIHGKINAYQEILAALKLL
jgi:hypothetical protein